MNVINTRISFNNCVNLPHSKFIDIDKIFDTESISGFSNDYCILLYTKLASLYTRVIAKYVMIFNYSYEDLIAKFDLENVISKFACLNIDLYEYFDKYNIIFRKDDDDCIYVKDVDSIYVLYTHIIATSSNEGITTNTNNLLKTI